MISAEIRDDALQRLNAAFNDYLAQTGKEPKAALVSRGQWLSWNLYRAFTDIAPPPGSILRAAVARGWRMGRKDGNASFQGISMTTWKRVNAMMQGNKSILAYTIPGTARISPLQIGARGRFVLGNKQLKTKRVASGPSAVAAYQKTKGVRLYSMRYVARAMGAKILGRHAVAVALEAQLREQGRRFLGVSWLHRRWRSLAQSDPRRADGSFRVLQNNNPRSKFNPLGVVELSGGDTSAQLKLTSNVPGMDSERANQIIARVLNEETMGIQTYLLNRSAKRLTNALANLSQQNQ